jgi:DNA (cytosine-5)-methyltransferase 1
MTVGSLFSGVGGFELAAERVWGHGCVRWSCEIDPFAREVLAKNWPDLRVYGDVRELTGESVEPVDLLCGGFPCQDVSGAGLRAGIEGERSGLWAEFARLIADLRPRYVLVENVPGLLERGMGRVLGDLAAIGFDAEWDCIPAAAVGAPHIRDRVWVVAYPTGVERSVLRDRDGQPHRRTPEIGGWFKAKRCSDRHSFDLGPRHCLARMWSPQPGVQRVLDGVPDRPHRLKAVGNAVQVEVVEFVFRLINAAECSGAQVATNDLGSRDWKGSLT